MSSAAMSARLHHLHAAATMLAQAAPGTAAALEAEVTRITDDHEILLPESRSKDACNACGGVLIPGLSCKVLLEPEGGRSKKASRRERSKAGGAKAAKKFKVMVYECKRCGRCTRLPVPPLAKMKQGPRPAPLATSASVSDQLVSRDIRSLAVDTPTSVFDAGEVAGDHFSSPAKASSNASSKQRAKARKQSGLQAMLAKNKADTSASAGAGLSLMDFMKMG